MSKIRVLLAEERALMRDGLRLFVNSQSDMEVVAEAIDGEQTWQVALDIKPDIILLNFAISNMTGDRVARHLMKYQPEIRILMISYSLDEAQQNQMCTWGVAGYLTEQVDSTQLVNAIRQIMAGGRVFMNKDIVENSTFDMASSVHLKLKAKEVAVLKLVAYGHTNIEIAKLMNLSVKSIEAHKTHINQKLGFKTRAEIVVYAYKQGWLFDA